MITVNLLLGLMKEKPENVIRFVYLLMKEFEKCGGEEVVKIVDSLPANFVEDAEFMNTLFNQNPKKLSISGLRKLFATNLTEQEIIKEINSVGIPMVLNGEKITMNFKSRQSLSKVDLVSSNMLQHSAMTDTIILERSI